MSTCGAETDIVGGVVCDRAVDHDGPHQAAAWVPAYEYGAGDPERVLTTVTRARVTAP